MDFGDTLFLPMPVENLAFGVPDQSSVIEATERIEPFLKGQGYLPLGGKLNVLNPSVEEASRVLDLLFRLTSQQQLDDRAREQLRDQADKDRVALAHAAKKNETLEESNKRLAGTVKELEGKLLASKHKAEEQERDLRQKLQSTTTRLNGYLYGGRDAGKRGAVAGMGGAGAGGARRAAPAYDRFRDDPAEAAASTQKLEAEMAQLRQQNAKLGRDLVTARKQLASMAHGGGLGGSGGSPHRDGRRLDQTEGPESRLGAQPSSLDMQSARHALLTSLSGDTDASAGSISPNTELIRLQRMVRDLQLEMERSQRAKQEQQRLLEKGAAERAELHKTLHSLRSKCAHLEVERRNAEDRFQRAQRASAALLDPAAAEAQVSDLRARLTATEKEMHEANARADRLRERLAVAEADVEAGQRHVEMLKRAVRVMPKGQQALEQLGKLVDEELAPLHAKLRKMAEELETSKATLERACNQRVLATESPEPSTGGAAMMDTPSTCSTAQPEEAELPAVRTQGPPLSPSATLPSSPSARFDGFATKNMTLADSPPLVLHPPPTHAFYNRAFSSTMPSQHTEGMLPDLVTTASTAVDTHTNVHSNPVQSYHQLPETGFGAGPGAYGSGVGAAGGTQPGNAPSSGQVGSPYMRRSVSAGVSHRMGEQYTSIERQRARWQVHISQAPHRFPSPIDIIMEQARNPASEVDSTISIRTIVPEGHHTGAVSQGSSP